MTGDDPDKITSLKINDKMVSDIVETEATHTPNTNQTLSQAGMRVEFPLNTNSPYQGTVSKMGSGGIWIVKDCIYLG